MSKRNLKGGNKMKKTYTIEEAREVLGVGRDAMYKLVKDDNFPKIIVGKRVIIPIKSLERWIDKYLDDVKML